MSVRDGRRFENVSSSDAPVRAEVATAERGVGQPRGFSVRGRGADERPGVEGVVGLTVIAYAMTGHEVTGQDFSQCRGLCVASGLCEGATSGETASGGDVDGTWWVPLKSHAPAPAARSRVEGWRRRP